MTRAALTRWIEPGLAWLYPPVCQLCEEHRATPAEGFVCAKCWTQVRFIKPPFCKRCGLPFVGEITTTFECSGAIPTGGLAGALGRHDIVAKDSTGLKSATTFNLTG